MRLTDLYFACHLGYIWSENEIFLFAVLIPFVDSKWKLHTRLAIYKDYDDLPPTDDNVSELTKSGLLSTGVGDDDTIVQDCINVCNPDESSNMLKGWIENEGACCVCHRRQN